jgi:putative ABC transport system permease protein
LFKLAFSNLWRRKLRSMLSIFMVAVGVAAIIALTSLADGIFVDIKTAVAQVQGIIVFQNNPYGPLFSQIDESLAEKIKELNGVKEVYPTILQPAKSVEGKKFSYTLESVVRLIGSKFEKASDKLTVIRGEIIEGRALKSGDRKKVVIGTEIKEQYNKFVGNKISINGERFEIVGIYRTGSKYLNRGILMQLDDMRELISFPKNKVAQLNVELENPGEADRIAKLIRFKLGDKFRVISSSQFAESLANILGDLHLFVLAVASLAAFVAAIGIINTMLMSVMERYKEIGTLKATGWTNSNIMQII